MSNPTPTVVLVHGAFAESASWNEVIKDLHTRGITSTAVANPLRSLSGDAEYVRDVVTSIGGPVLLVGHSYGGMVITQAAADNPAVTGLVYVSAFAPDTDESALQLSSSFPGSTLGDALDAYPLADGGTEFAIRRDVFGEQFAGDVPAPVAGLMGATQRPVTEAALAEGLPSASPAWKTLPSWFVFGDQDRNIPAAALRFQAERANARTVNEVGGASHAISVSRPDVVADLIAIAHAEVSKTAAA